jgi:hypothetical protein
MAIASRYEESGGERYGISQARLPLVISGTLPILSKTASNRRIETTREAISGAATDPAQMAARVELAKFTSQRFDEVGTLLHVSGHIVGPDRKSGASPFGHGSDETVAISLLLRIASQLISASTDSFLDGRSYAAAALIRQMVEVEYLAWAFETRDHDAERWLRSSKDERQEFFTPAKLRKAAGERFRSKDYGYHCELGGHPVPTSAILLRDQASISQMLLSDSLGHAGRIWDHLVGWARLQNEPFILEWAAEMSSKFCEWKSRDALVDLPPPP